MKKRYFYLLMLLLLLLPLSTAAASQAEEKYEIYPIPQNEKDLGTDFTLTNEVNLVAEDGIDTPTKEFLEEILSSKSIEVNTSDQIVPSQTNILLGTKGSNGYVDNYFNKNIAYDSTIFEKIDPYVLAMDTDLEENGTIAILGKDTESAFYGLETLKMITDQISGKKIHAMQYEDYADSKWRGFIEGFYGFPWSHESRISLMEFGGKIKMNAYIYGPKDEKYHNSQWRKPYPEEELAKIQELAEVGHKTKTQFIWAIHPGFSMIDWDNYDQELGTLLAKLDQVYGAGVRQFGLFMDDISTAQSLKDTEKHMKLVKDIADWVEAKGDVKPLIYTPPFYNKAWTGEAGKPYLEAMSTLPKDVEIMWTGDDVIGTVNQPDMQWVKDFIGRDPFVWLNWPVNGYAGSRLLLGEGEHFLEKGTHNISGVVSNPLEQAELSKVAIFAVGDFAWNVDDYNSKQSWEDSFNYIAPNAASELRTIAHHASDPSPNRRGVVLEESENIKVELDEFMSKFQQEEPVEVIGEQLIDEFNQILDAITGFREKSTNEQMRKEIEPWLNSLEEVVQADKYAVQSAIAFQGDDLNTAWEELGKAANAMDRSTTFPIEKYNGKDVPAEIGAKRLVPFANKLIKQLDADIHLEIDPEAMANIPTSSYEGQNLDNMVDEDPDTYAYVKVLQKNGDWYGLDLGKTVAVKDIQIVQGRNNNDHDIFHRGILEYSTDGESWQAIGEEQSGYNVEVNNVEIEARYVRYRLTHAGVPGGKDDLWTAVRDFRVNGKQATSQIYTNVAALQEIEVKTEENLTKIQDVPAITLKPSDYIGVSLQTIEQIKEIYFQGTTDKLTLEVSENGVEWQEIAEENSYPNAAYVRLVNKKDKAITFDLEQFTIQTETFTEPVVSHNYPGTYAGKAPDLYDGDWDSKVWFNGSQDAGRYVQVDMGGLIHVKDIAVVIDDGEGDYFRQGDLQISKDGETWQTIHTFENPGDRSLNFPDHEAPYRLKRVQVDNEETRFVRLVSTEKNSKWLALNEIIVNEGMEKPGTKNLTVQAEPKGAPGNEAAHVIDGKLATFYTPEGDAQAGQLNYKLSENTKVGELLILQSPQAITDAEVFIRDLDGWHNVGSLSQSLTELDTSGYEHVLEIKIEWSGAVKPQIHEIIPVRKKAEGPAVESVADLKALVKQFGEAGEITDEEAVRKLDTHLTTVEHFEKDENVGKLVKHLQGFKQLLAYYHQQGKIIDLAYEELNKATEALIVKYE
ncbi:beta-N-acetylglucosaminidase domain-containing protein [Virgibacillus halodenitrificans]|uniref:beta-N-acetylglucosaminidase domain-containing protein n=1 Tax=Virgibacillus halodenitrificans TaxID=1482 RepID=UPI001F189159|nr:beta-N-acetylglucosaminidase domain-containing protein [Virgibacillus halodenitrificans]